MNVIFYQILMLLKFWKNFTIPFNNLIKQLSITHKKQIILAGDFNLFFDSKLEAKSGKSTVKQEYIMHFTELKERFDSCNIWRIRNPLKKSYTFKQNHFSDIINCRLDYNFSSNKMKLWQPLIIIIIKTTPLSLLP